MIFRRLAPLVAMGVVALLSGCASSPAPVLLTLDAPLITAPGQAHRPVVVVGPVSVPDSIDRPQLMLQTGPNRIEAAPNMRWAQPYKLEVARALAAHLAQVLGNPRVVPASAGATTGSFLRVAVDVLSLELREGESVVMEVLWSVRASDTGTLLASARSVVREVVTGKGGEALAAAQSRALAKLALEMAPAFK